LIGRARSRPGRSIELVVDAGADDVRGEADIFRDAGHDIERLTIAEIDVEIFDLGAREPDIQIWNVNLRGDRSLTLRHTQHKGRPLADSAEEVLKHVARLWGFGVNLESVDSHGDVTMRWTLPAPTH
jgi:spore cortex formation protein SpoVR/YcgB (stage V sporulation)